MLALYIWGLKHGIAKSVDNITSLITYFLKMAAEFQQIIREL